MGEVSSDHNNNKQKLIFFAANTFLKCPSEEWYRKNVCAIRQCQAVLEAEAKGASTQAGQHGLQAPLQGKN